MQLQSTNANTNKNINITYQNKYINYKQKIWYIYFN